MASRSISGNNSTRRSFGFEKDEFDNVERFATIYLFKSATSSARSMMHPDSSGATPLGNHWALVVHFEPGNRYIRLEAFGEDGKIIPKITHERPRESGIEELLGETQISPKKLLELASINPLNGTSYITFGKNCQNWVKELARSIGGNIKSTIENKTTDTTQLVGFGTFCAGVGGVVCALIQIFGKK